MERKERLKRMRDALRIAIKRREDFVTITNPETGKFIQLAIIRSKRAVVMDIPLVELSGDELEDLKHMLNAEVARDPLSKELISVQKLFHLNQLDAISRTVDEIFLEVFGLSDDYGLSIEVFPR